MRKDLRKQQHKNEFARAEAKSKKIREENN